MLWFLGFLGAIIALIWSARWFMRSPPRQIAALLRQVIRFVVLLLVSSRGGIFASLLPLFWNIRRMRSRSRSGSPGGRAPPPRGAHSGLTRAQAAALLGVSPHATRGDINRAWRTLMLEAHPDKGGSLDQAAQLNHARDVLLKK